MILGAANEIALSDDRPGYEGRWVIVSPSDSRLGWSGRRWVPFGGQTQICNFPSQDEAYAYARAAGLYPWQSVHYDRRGAQRRRTLTASEIVEQERIGDAMRKYELAERQWERHERLAVWKGLLWGLFLSAIVAGAIAWVLSRHG